VGLTCQTPLSAPGPPGSTPLPRSCHAPHRARALNALSGPRVGVPTTSHRSDRPRSDRLSEPPLLISPRPVPTTPSPLSEATPPFVSEARRCPAVSAVARFVHGERRPSPPLTVFHLWSIELTSPSLLPVTGPPPATVAPPRRKNTAAEPIFSPSPSTRSSGELFSPSPCPTGSITAVGARPPPFAPPPLLWVLDRGRPGKRRPRATHTGRASAVNVGHALCAHGPSWRRERGPRVHCASEPSVISAQWQPI
jgi:hypothetical protein